ncbi:MAG: hypothetical protein ACREGF_01930, partial [Candidatus Saccharimonadales bacterium]
MRINTLAGATLVFLACASFSQAQQTPPANQPTSVKQVQPPPPGRRLQVPDQVAPGTVYDYHAAFGPPFYTKNGNEYRAADGEPGPKYWQNRADYQLAATLNDVTNKITGSEILTYTNNSPQRLSFLWMNLEQNLFKLDSR